MRIEISACENLARWHQTRSWLFYFTYESGMAWQCPPDFMLQNFLFQLRPLPPWHKEQQCNAAEEVKGSCAVASRCPGSDCSRPTLQSVEWAATHPCPGAICVSQLNHGMGRNLLLPIFCRTHFLSFGRQTCCLHNTTARQVSRNKTKTGDTLLKRFYQTA